MDVARLKQLATLGAMLVATAACGQPDRSQDNPLSDDAIKQILSDASVALYRGNCPCPESRKADGTRCGRSSAYSRGSGDKPLCYPKDVPDDSVRRYRDQMSLR